MKRFTKGLLAAALLAVVMAGAFFAGGHMSDKEHAESRTERGRDELSSALDALTDKGLLLEGAPEAVASHLWAAHELCGDAGVSAELSDLWNAVVYEDAPEEVLISRLEDVMARYQ